MNVNEYGNFIRINANKDISGNTNTLTLKSPTPIVRTKIVNAADGLVVPNIPIVVGSETFLADEYVEYRTKVGDIFVSGDWEARLFSNDVSADRCEILDEVVIFTVDP